MKYYHLENKDFRKLKAFKYLFSNDIIWRMGRKFCETILYFDNKLY